MTCPLAVFTYQLGSLSETFIKRHVESLLPGETAVLTLIDHDEFGGHWRVNCPTLVLEQIRRPRLRRQIIEACLKSLGIKSSPDFRLSVAKNFLVKNGVRVVLAQYLNGGWDRWISPLEALGIKLFVHTHGNDISQCLRNPEWRQRYVSYNKAAGIITMSHNSVERLVNIGLNRRQIHVVPYGVDVPVWSGTEFEGENIRCIAVGRMTGKKAPILLLDSFRRALEGVPTLRLDYVGDGPLMPAVIHFTKSIGLGDGVKLHGGQLHNYGLSLMARADIFIQHSVVDPITGDEEGLPVAILEAMAHGLPVVSTYHAGISEAVVDGVTGFLVNEGDTKSMAARICQLAKNARLRRDMGAAGWKRAKEKFAWEQERSTLLNILELAE